MGTQSLPSAEKLAAAQQKLKSTHAKLVREFEKLRHAKFSAVNHEAYLQKLKAHLVSLEAHTAAVHARHEALHAERQELHAQHEAKGLHPASPPKTRRAKRRR